MIKRHFFCKTKDLKWSGNITSFIDYGSHYEMRIESLSSITVLFGKTSMGNFVCIPDFEVGCHLATLNDDSYNKEKISGIINQVDAITIARALKTVFNH